MVQAAVSARYVFDLQVYCLRLAVPVYLAAPWLLPDYAV